MQGSGLIISEIRGVTVVNFRDVSILDGVAIEQISDQLYALVDEKARRKLVLDFSHVKFLCSTMLGVLVSLEKKSQAIGGKTVICGLRPELYKVFKIMNLHKVLEFAESEEKALNSFDVFTKP